MTGQAATLGGRELTGVTDQWVARFATVWALAILVSPAVAGGVCVQTTITPPGQGAHVALALTDPAGEQTATFDLVWGGMLASLRYNGVEQLFGGHTIAMVQPNLYYYFGPNQYAPFAAGDYALRGSNVPGAYCTTPDKIFVLTGLTDFAAGASGNTPLGAVQDGVRVIGKYAAPYTLTTVARFVSNPLGQPKYYLKLENQLANNHPTESLPFGFWLKGSMLGDHTYSAVSPASCQDQSSNCPSAQTSYLVAGGYTDPALTNGVAFYVSPQTDWNTFGARAFATFASSTSPSFRSANLVTPIWAVPPLTVRSWSWHVLAGRWTYASSFAQAGGPEFGGNLDGADCHVIAGWAWDAKRPNTSINVDIYDGTTLLGTVPANQYRADLVAAGFGNGIHGFSFNTPAVVRNGQLHSLRAVPSGSVVDLGNSPRSLTCPSEKFYTLAPCRIIDTRGSVGPYGGPALNAQATRNFIVAGQCGLPTTARAVAINITLIGASTNGSVTIFPGDLPQVPLARTASYGAGQTRSNNGVVGLDPFGTLSVFTDQPSGSVHFILDVTGYFQ